MKMKTKIILISFLIISALSISLAYSTGITGNLYKAFSKTVYPNDNINQNITVRKYFNMTVRFRYSIDGSDLSFDDPDGTVILKDSNGEIDRVTGIKSGKIYAARDKMQIDSIKYVELLNVDKYDTVNSSEVSITYYATKAYLTIIVVKKQGSASLQGYIIDELTNQSLDGITVLAYDKGSDINTTDPLGQSVSENGKYSLNFQTDADGKELDIYVKDYLVS
jgi:hypothetical protein